MAYILSSKKRDAVETPKKQRDKMNPKIVTDEFDTDPRSFIIGKEITLQPHLCQPCCHSFKIRQRRLYTQPKHWSAVVHIHVGPEHVHTKALYTIIYKHGGAEA